MNAHTPGPWRKAWGKIVDQEDKAVCLLVQRKGAENFPIIAAAPDMFDALQAVCDAYGDCDTLLMAQVKAALAKAQG